VVRGLGAGENFEFQISSRESSSSWAPHAPAYHSTGMESLDPAGDFLRISEHYRGLRDGELLALAAQPAELTDIAQRALANELSSRRLKLPLNEAPTAPEVLPPLGTMDPNDPSYDEDRYPVTIRTVWSVADALQLQRLLDVAGIPFYMGPEQATGVDRVTSNSTDGLEVRIMNVGVPWALQAMKNYWPVSDRPPKAEKEPLSEIPVHCPKCHSAEVIFEARPLPEIFNWICDSCGHRWEDNGVLRED
jgi:hypothetical protein